MPALEARFDGDKERSLLSGDERGARQCREGFPDEDRARLKRGPRTDRERGDTDAEHRAWTDAQSEGADVRERELGVCQGFLDAAKESFEGAIRRDALPYPAAAGENSYPDSGAGGAVEDEAGFGRAHGLSLAAKRGRVHPADARAGAGPIHRHPDRC